MAGAPDSWRPLGELFVQRGLITHDELAGALDEQSRTGRRLGTILISRGIVSEPELTSALVEQIGIDGLLDELEIAAAEVDTGRSERRGFLSRRSKGGDDEAVDAAEAARPLPLSLAPEHLQPDTPRPEEPQPRRSGGRGPLSWLTSMRQSLDDAEAEAARLTGKLEGAAKALSDERARAAEREAMLDRETERREAAEIEIEGLRAKVAEQADALSKLEARAGDLAAKIAATASDLDGERHARELAEQEHERAAAELAAHEAEAGRLSRQLHGLIANVHALSADHERAVDELRARERQVAELEILVAGLPREIDSPQTASARPLAVPESSPAFAPNGHATTFLVLVPRADDTHELVERTGAPPAVGDELPLGDRRFAVERIGRSPIPFDRRPCVQLRALP